MALVCTQPIPLFDAGTSSKSAPAAVAPATGGGGGAAARSSPRGQASAPRPAAPAIRSTARRESVLRGVFTSMGAASPLDRQVLPHLDPGVRFRPEVPHHEVDVAVVVV